MTPMTHRSLVSAGLICMLLASSVSALGMQERFVKYKPAHVSGSAASTVASDLFGGGVNGYAQNAINEALVSLDFTTPGALTTIGAPNARTIAGGGFLNGDTSTLYMLGDSGFFSINTTTGIATSISVSAGGGDVWAMAPDPSTQTLYWVGPTLNQRLSTIDPVTGATKLVAAISGAATAGVISAIAADAAGELFGIAYGIDSNSGSLIRIDKATGVTIVVGPLGIRTRFVAGLTFDPATQTLYFADGDTGLYTVDPVNGHATFIGAVQDSRQLVALAIPGIEDTIFCNGFDGSDCSAITQASPDAVHQENTGQR